MGRTFMRTSVLYLFCFLSDSIKSFTSEFQEKSDTKLKWASPRENLSSGFPPKRVSNQSPQLQRLAKKLKFHL